MRLSIRHQLSLSPPPGTGQAVLHLLLTPPAGSTQQVMNWSIEAPGMGNAGRFTDAYGNRVHLVNQSRPDGTLVIVATGVVETSDTHGVLGRAGGEPVPALYKRTTALAKAPAGLLDDIHASGESRLDVLHALMARVGEMLGDGGVEAQTQADRSQSQSQGQGSEPRDGSAHAHAFIGAARALDIPARYVTGYLEGTDGIHAWAEAYDEGLGWIGFDPLLQLCPTERHVRLAVALDAAGAQPLRAVPAGDGVRAVVSVVAE